MEFLTDERIASSSQWLVDAPLSKVYLKNEADFPWLILVPRQNDLQEIYQLSEPCQKQLMEEIVLFSKLMKDYFKPDKLNVGALGNVVSQLHIHLVGRFKDDKAWPHGIWQPNVPGQPYEQRQLAEHILALRQCISESGILR
ncbi:MAG: HIT domain-containing protein [Tatlockia sp.]|jgi:diadenosine tetraphosphate (Ap4A) HIT family hydrolase